MAVESDLWRGVYEHIVMAPVEKVWECTSDFVGVHQWAPSISCKSTLLEGTPQTPGCLRYCESPPDLVTGANVCCANERLLEMDPVDRHYKYRVEKCTMPYFVGYISTFRLRDAGNETTLIAWSYEASPVPGFTEEKFRDSVFSVYDTFMKDLENFLSRNSEN